MKCELYLERKRTLPHAILRLPDVIGPYDNTDRFWTSIKWLKESNTHPILICE